MLQVELILRLNAMGDILLTVPTLRAMQARGITPHLLIHRRWHELAEFLPAKVHFYKGAAAMPRLLKELQRLEPLAIHDLQGKIATIAIRLWLKAPKTTEYIKRSLSEQLMAIRGRYPLMFADQRPVWQKYAQTCCLAIAEPDPSLNLDEKYLEQSRKLLHSFNLREKQFIAIHADASKPGKVLPRNFLETLARNAETTLVFIGTGSGEIPESERIIDLRNQLSLRELPGLLKLAGGLVSSDSGPMHLGRAVNTPVAGIFLQTSPALGFSPVPGPKVLIISEELNCKPCSLHGQREECPEGSFACRKLNAGQNSADILAFFRKFQ